MVWWLTFRILSCITSPDLSNVVSVALERNTVCFSAWVLCVKLIFLPSYKGNMQTGGVLLCLANMGDVDMNQFTIILCATTKTQKLVCKWIQGCKWVQDGLSGEPRCLARFWILTFQSSEHFLVTPTVSFNLTTPVVFFRFFMQPRKAGVEMLNLIWGTKKKEMYQTRLVWEVELKLSSPSGPSHPQTSMCFVGTCSHRISITLFISWSWENWLPFSTIPHSQL